MKAEVVYERHPANSAAASEVYPDRQRVGFKVGNRIFWVGGYGYGGDWDQWKKDETLCRIIVTALEAFGTKTP